MTTECSRLVVHSDSELIVRQMNRQYKVKDARLKKQFQQIQNILASVPFQFMIVHVPRENNQEADELANRGIDTKKILTI